MAAVKGYESIEVSSLTPHIGAEVSGVDLRQPLSNEQFSEIYRAWLDWQEPGHIFQFDLVGSSAPTAMDAHEITILLSWACMASSQQQPT